MLSLVRCRRLLDPSTAISDEQLLALRNQLYDLARVTVNAGTRPPGETGDSPFRRTLRMMPEELRDDAEERAAIVEFDGARERSEAERRALVDVIGRNEDHDDENA